MSMISGIAQSAMSSPSSRMQSLLQNDVSSGAIPQADQAALSSALNDIASQFQSATSTTSTASAATATTTSSSSSGTVGSQLDGMIDSEVSSGKLTSDQATELKGLFAQAQQKMHVGHHHHGGGGGALSALLGTDSTTSTDGTTTAATDAITGLTTGTADGTSSSSSTSTLSAPDQATTSLASFVKQLRSAVQGGGLYGSAGSTVGSLGSMLVSAFA